MDLNNEVHFVGRKKSTPTYKIPSLIEVKATLEPSDKKKCKALVTCSYITKRLYPKNLHSRHMETVHARNISSTRHFLPLFTLPQSLKESKSYRDKIWPVMIASAQIWLQTSKQLWFSPGSRQSIYLENLS